MLKRKIRHKRIRAKVFGTSEKPRLSVFRSSKAISAQLIDDEKGKTIVSAKSQDIKSKEKGKVSLAYNVGKSIAQKALKEKIKEVVFDRGGYIYHGRIKEVADGAREGGLIF